MLLLFLEGATLALPATLQPGPLQAVLASQALNYGWRRAMPAAFAPLATDGFTITLVLLVLTRTPPWLLLGLRMLGGVLLAYLAVETLRRWNRPPPTAEVDPAAAQKSFLRAFLVNLVNPNAYLFWGVIGGPILLEAWKNQPSDAVAFVIGFFLTFISSLALFVLFVGSAREVSTRVHQTLVLISGVALGFFALWQLGSGLRELLA